MCRFNFQVNALCFYCFQQMYERRRHVPSWEAEADIDIPLLVKYEQTIRIYGTDDFPGRSGHNVIGTQLVIHTIAGSAGSTGVPA